jgi:hypothetical protein
VKLSNGVMLATGLLGIAINIWAMVDNFADGGWWIAVGVLNGATILMIFYVMNVAATTRKSDQ